ncbi:glycogen synthase GlgA [Ensifer soli]|uniref:glycogen synthase GlgA n=1 Tax=Ciceribacter sp. sgz301302 TaxID=3342379 RepID=UPI0035B82AE3
MKILSVASEMFPLVKTGGLGDVTGSLPLALSRDGIEMRTMLPAYPGMLAKADACACLGTFRLLGEEAALFAAHAAGLDLLLLDAPALFDRDGGPYADATGRDHADNDRRFAALSLAAAEFAEGALGGGWRPDLVHTHDWQAALTSVYLRHRQKSRLPVILTIHNLAFQGQFAFSRLRDLGLPPEAFSTDCLEYYGDVSFLKGGIRTADAVTTVSPTYAREILGAGLGMGMEGVLADRRDALTGIVNGIDPDVWNPATDPHVLSRYDGRTIERRRINRKHLINEFGLADGPGPIFSVVSRLTWQKGIDLVIENADRLVETGGRLIVCGQGEPGLEGALRDLARRHPGRIAARIGYDEKTAHLIHAGTDFVLQPSRFEPCGLTQLYALRYGAVPVVSRTGGLAETVIDANEAAFAHQTATGIQFHPVSAEHLGHALDRAVALFSTPHLYRRVQAKGMETDFSWKASASRYARLYRSLTGLREPIGPDAREIAPARHFS